MRYACRRTLGCLSSKRRIFCHQTEFNVMIINIGTFRALCWFINQCRIIHVCKDYSKRKLPMNNGIFLCVSDFLFYSQKIVYFRETMNVHSLVALALAPTKEQSYEVKWIIFVGKNATTLRIQSAVVCLATITRLMYSKRYKKKKNINVMNMRSDYWKESVEWMWLHSFSGLTSWRLCRCASKPLVCAFPIAERQRRISTSVWFNSTDFKSQKELYWRYESRNERCSTH